MKIGLLGSGRVRKELEQGNSALSWQFRVTHLRPDGAGSRPSPQGLQRLAEQKARFLADQTAARATLRALSIFRD